MWHCLFGTTALRGESGSITRWPGIILRSGGQRPTQQPLVRRGIFPISANTSGMTGVTTENTQQNFHTTKKSLGMCWVPQEVRAMRWPSGSSKQMGMWSQDTLYDHYKCQKYTAHPKYGNARLSII